MPFHKKNWIELIFKLILNLPFLKQCFRPLLSWYTQLSLHPKESVSWVLFCCTKKMLFAIYFSTKLLITQQDLTAIIGSIIFNRFSCGLLGPQWLCKFCGHWLEHNAFLDGNQLFSTCQELVSSPLVLFLWTASALILPALRWLGGLAQDRVGHEHEAEQDDGWRHLKLKNSGVIKCYTCSCILSIFQSSTKLQS